MAGHRAQIVMAATGSGKTFLALRLCSEALARGGRVLFVCDRKTLINQTSAVADSYGMPTHGVLQADHPRMALWRPFQIASAQTIAARGLTDDYSLVVVDEAHTIYKPVTALIASTKAAVIGLSATPFTKGLGKIYSRVINAATMAELTTQGILAPLRVMSCVAPDMANAKTTSKGEWAEKESEERGMRLIGDVVQEWTKHAENRKTIVFGPTVVHCEEMARQFLAAGVKAATFTGLTTDAEREALLREYRKPDSELRVLVSVEALAKGFDVPDVGCVVDCRPLRKSLSTWIQMIGRGLRCSPGKLDCLLIDHSGNAGRFANSFAEFFFNGLADLDSGEKLDKEDREIEKHEAKACPACKFKPCGKKCIRCGFESQRVSAVAHEKGEAVELDILKRKGEAEILKYAPTRHELYRMLATYTKRKGHAEGAAAHKYKDITGNWPPREFNFKWAEAEPSPALLAKLRSMQIAFAKAKKANR